MSSQDLVLEICASGKISYTSLHTCPEVFYCRSVDGRPLKKAAGSNQIAGGFSTHISIRGGWSLKNRTLRAAGLFTCRTGMAVLVTAAAGIMLPRKIIRDVSFTVIAVRISTGGKHQHYCG